MEFLRVKDRILKQRREKTCLNQEEKLKRKKETDIKALILEVLFYLVFLACFLAMAFSNRDDRAFLYFKTTSIIMDREATVGTDEDMWVWIRDQMLPFLYVTRDWSGRARNGSSRMVSTFAAYRLGPVRIRQHRIRPASCQPTSEFSNPKIRCSPSWSVSDRDWRNYFTGWSRQDDFIGNLRRTNNNNLDEMLPGNVTQFANFSIHQGKFSGHNDNSSLYAKMNNSNFFSEMGNSSLYPNEDNSYVNKLVYSDFHTRIDNSSVHTMMDNSSVHTMMDNSSFHTKIDNSFYSSAWRYQTWSDIGGLPITGVIGLYPPGGYVLDIVSSRAHASLEYLRTNSWVDDRTRVVIAELTIYSPNVNMFAMVTALFEFSQARVVIGQVYMHPFRLFTYSDDYPVTKIITDWLVYLALIFFGIRQSYFIYRDRLKYFTHIWNIFESVNLLMSAAAIALSVGRVVVADHVAKEANQDQGHFYNYQTLAMWDQLAGILAAFACFLSTLQVLHLLRFNKRMSVLGATMRLAASELAPFSIVFLLVLLAFASFCYIMFGSWLPGYRSIIDTLEALILVSLGDFDYSTLVTVNRVFAPVFIFLYMIFIVFLLINILITILMDSFADVRDDVNKQPDDFELIDYIVLRCTYVLWNYNPFRILWAIASYLGVVSHSTPDSRRPEPIQQNSEQKSDQLVSVKPIKRFLTRFQLNMAKVEIGLDKMDDTLDYLWDVDKTILTDIVLRLGSQGRRNVPAVKAMCSELHVPVMVAMCHGLGNNGDVPTADNISDLSYDSDYLETDITFNINISEICFPLERGSYESDQRAKLGILLDNIQDMNSTVSGTISLDVVPKSNITDIQSCSPDKIAHTFITVPKYNIHDTKTPDIDTASQCAGVLNKMLTLVSETEPPFCNVQDYMTTPVSPFVPDYMTTPVSPFVPDYMTTPVSPFVPDYMTTPVSPFIPDYMCASVSDSSTPAHVVPEYNFHDTYYTLSEMASPGGDVLDYSMQDTSQTVSEMTSPCGVVPNVVRRIRHRQNLRKHRMDLRDDQAKFPRKLHVAVQNKTKFRQHIYSVDVHSQRLNNELLNLEPGQEESQV